MGRQPLVEIQSSGQVCQEVKLGVVNPGIKNKTFYNETAFFSIEHLIPSKVRHLKGFWSLEV